MLAEGGIAGNNKHACMEQSAASGVAKNSNREGGHNKKRICMSQLVTEVFLGLIHEKKST